MVTVHYSAAVHAALESVDLDAAPPPTEAFAWPVACDFTAGAAAAQRLRRAGFIIPVSRHEARVGTVDRGGIGWSRTTDELYWHARAVQGADA